MVEFPTPTSKSARTVLTNFPASLGLVEILRPPLEPRPDTVVSTIADHGLRVISLDSPAELEIRGRLGPPEEATLTCSNRFPSGLGVVAPMLRLGAAVSSARLHAVSFDARGKGSTCVQIDIPGPRQATQVPFDLSLCRFKSARDSLVTVDGISWRALRSRLSGQAAPPADSRATVPTIQAEGCVFVSEAFPAAHPVAVRVMGPVGSSAEFRACTFAGGAFAMIHASSVTPVLSGCRFANAMIPDKLRAPVAPSAWPHADGPEGGVDVYLDEAVALPHVPPNAPSVVPPLERFEMGSISAQDCRSTSPQFLVTATPRGTSIGRDGTVIGLHHAFNHTGVISSRSKPPAIHWRAPAEPYIRGATIILIGCRFDGVVPDGAPRVIAARNDLHPALIDCGICSGDDHLRGVSDPLIVPRLISTTVLGDIPPRG